MVDYEVKNFVFSSSAAVYGQPEFGDFGLINEEYDFNNNETAVDDLTKNLIQLLLKYKFVINNNL